MAVMFPRTLLEDEVKSPGEVAVFGRLRDGLDDDWHVHHSVSWIARDPGDGALDGEIDFVLAHPDNGIVCLEVKGGPIACRHGEWLRQGVRVKDPFLQALDHRYALERLIGAGNGHRTDRLRIAHAVAFPDVTVHGLALAPDAPAEILIDRHGCEDIAAAIDRVLAYHAGARDKRSPLGTGGMTRLRELLAPEVRIDVPMSAAFADEERALLELTADQSLLLARMRRNHRMAIYGCAGSGKTMLAVEHARRLACDGREVLFVCFNRALAAHLHETAPDERVHYTTFHRLCTRVAHQAGVELPAPGDPAPPAYFEETLPDALVQALDVLGPQWDALIVDEAQDLETDWLDSLRLGLRDEENAPIWLFLDDNQRIYDSGLVVPADCFRWELTVNCRNTEAIHRELVKLYEGQVVPEVRGPEGRQPELHLTADQPATVARLLDRLLSTDDIAARDIVVLSSHGAEKSEVHGALAGRLVLERPKRGPQRAPLFSSIRAFKGLESPVILLCELEDLDAATRDQQLYVGLSRARNHCLIVAPKPA